MWKDILLVGNSISTTATVTTKACMETFGIQSGSLSCSSVKVLHILKSKVRDEVLYVRKAKTKFRYTFNSYKSKHKTFRKGNRKTLKKPLQNHYCLDGHIETDDWEFTLSEQCETYKQRKERERLLI